MPKIQTIGAGNFIKNPRGTKTDPETGIRGADVWYIQRNEGSAYLCYPVKNARPLELDYSRYQFIPVDTEVKRASP